MRKCFFEGVMSFLRWLMTSYCFGEKVNEKGSRRANTSPMICISVIQYF